MLNTSKLTSYDALVPRKVPLPLCLRMYCKTNTSIDVHKSYLSTSTGHAAKVDSMADSELQVTPMAVN